MKYKQKEIDEMIRDALAEEEAQFYDSLDEQNLPEMVGGLFYGKMKWLVILTMIIQVIMFGLAVYCIIQFFQHDDIKSMIRWGAGGFFFLISTSFIKLYHWLQMHRNAMLREMKRLELQVTILAGKSVK